MYENGKIYMGLAGDKRVELALNMCNRHGLIAGASGTGKTVTMKVMAESFSDAGVPVFLCDVKGDVAGICAPGQSSGGMEKRIDKFGLRDRFVYQGYPTTFWDVYQEGGHAVRATVSDMGPELLSRILGLTAVQEGILHIVFQIADDKGLLLIDLKDLRAMLTYVSEHRAEYMMTYGNITSQSVAAILRALLPLEQQGGELFFGEPALDIRDWMRTAADGRGMINVLDCVKLVQNPTLYASFLLWMLSELFEILPEAGDLDKPRMVFFFDEAHMLFRDAPRRAAAKGGADGEADPFPGRGRVLCDAKPQRYSRHRAGAAFKPGAARPPGLYPRGAEGCPRGGTGLPAQSRVSGRGCHHGAGRGRGADLVLGRSRRTRYGGAHEDHLPTEPHVSAGAHGPGQGDDA